jgi:hypothetical protein
MNVQSNIGLLQEKSTLEQRTNLFLLFCHLLFFLISSLFKGRSADMVFTFSGWKCLSCLVFVGRRFCPLRMVVILGFGSLFRWPILLVGIILFRILLHHRPSVSFHYAAPFSFAT